MAENSPRNRRAALPTRREKSLPNCLWVPFSAADTRAGGTLLTGLSESPRLGALTPPADAGAAAAAHLPVAGHAAVRLRGAVAVVPDVPSVALALPAVTLPVT